MRILAKQAPVGTLGELSVMHHGFGTSPIVDAPRRAIGVGLGSFRRAVLGQPSIDGSVAPVRARSNVPQWRRNQRVAARLHGIELDIHRTAQSAQTAPLVSARELRGAEIHAHFAHVKHDAQSFALSPASALIMGLGSATLILGTVGLIDVAHTAFRANLPGIGSVAVLSAGVIAGLLHIPNMCDTLDAGLARARTATNHHDRLVRHPDRWIHSGRNYMLFKPGTSQEKATWDDRMAASLIGPTSRVFASMAPSLRNLDMGWLGVDHLWRWDQESDQPLLTVVMRMSPSVPRYPQSDNATALAEMRAGMAQRSRTKW